MYSIINRVFLFCFLLTTNGFAADLTIASGDTGNGQIFLRQQLDQFEILTGNKVSIVEMPANSSDQFAQYRLWLAAGNSDVDLYRTDIVWAPQLADQFLDLSSAARDIISDHFAASITSQTVHGRLISLPLFADAAALYYRKDLLQKYDRPIPKTIDELTDTALFIQDAERKAGHKLMNGYVFQANAYEGLTCLGLEWIKTFGGGQIVEDDGTISVNNNNALQAIDQVKNWIGTIAPQGVLGYGEEESRGVWQTGNAVFLRNWSYVYPLADSDDSPIRGKFGVSPLPTKKAGEPIISTLGGWNIAVSKYSQSPLEAIELAKFLASAQSQKQRAMVLAALPTIKALYDDPQIVQVQPVLALWKPILLGSAPRPSAPTGNKYNEVSSLFWNAVHETLAGNGSAADNFALLEEKLSVLKGAKW